VRVEPYGGGSFIVITSPKRHFVHGEIQDQVYDDWVQDESWLQDYFELHEWVVEWLD
jgi:hypothetical protein